MATVAAEKLQYATDLACKFVKERHGEITERVCRTLCAKGLMGLPELMRALGPPEQRRGAPPAKPSADVLMPGQIKQALLLMIQHNLVHAYLQKDEEGLKNPRPPQVLYAPDVDRMLQLVRQPKFLLHIKEEAGVLHEHIVQLLLENGRLSWEQVVRAVAGKMGREAADVEKEVSYAFISLVQSHYVERAPPCSLPPPTPTMHFNARKRGRQSARGGEAQAAEQARFLRSLEEVRFDKERFRLSRELMVQAAMMGEGGESILEVKEEEEDAAAPKQPPTKKQRVKAGSKNAAPGGADAGAGASSSAAAEPEVLLWRVNFEEFNRRFRHRVCSQMVADKIDQDAGFVMEAMLSVSRQFEHRLDEERSLAMSVHEVEVELRKLAERYKREGELVVADVVNAIAIDSMELITLIDPAGPQGATYAVNMVRIVDLIKMKQLEAVVRDKFGVPGLRIFRLLCIRGQLEQKQVADFAMLPQKDTRELLYHMLRAGFVTMQDIPRTSERNPARTFYTWRANMTQASAHLAANLYRSMGNVFSRLLHEMERERELLDLLDEAKATQTMAFSLTEKQKGQLIRIRKVADVLQASLLHLDDMVAVFCNY